MWMIFPIFVVVLLTTVFVITVESHIEMILALHDRYIVKIVVCLLYLPRMIK